MAAHSSTLAWKVPGMEEPGRLQSMGSWRVRHDWVTSLSLFTFMHWRRKWQPTPVSLPGRIPGTGEPGGLPSVGSQRVGHDWSDLAAAAAAWFQGEYSVFCHWNLGWMCFWQMGKVQTHFAMLWTWNVCNFIKLKICMQWYFFSSYLKTFKIPKCVWCAKKLQKTAFFFFLLVKFCAFYDSITFLLISMLILLLSHFSHVRLCANP